MPYTYISKIFINVLAVVLTVFSVMTAQPVPAVSWFSGVGNDGYFNDVTGLYSILQDMPGWADITDNYLLDKDLSGIEIKDRLLSTAETRLQTGDRLFWFYSGHGSFDDDRDNDESAPGSTAIDRYDETIGLRDAIKPLTDDDAASAFSVAVQKGVTVITVFDTCYAGGFIGGLRDLNSIPGIPFMGSSAHGIQCGK